jgi:hypothetical protein
MGISLFQAQMLGLSPQPSTLMHLNVSAAAAAQNFARHDVDFRIRYIRRFDRLPSANELDMQAEARNAHKVRWKEEARDA